MNYEIEPSVLATNPEEELAKETGMRQFERTPFGQMPAIAQLAGLGAQQTWAGMQDIDDALTNDPIDFTEGRDRWKALGDLEDQIDLSTGQRGVKDIDMLDQMARYIPDAAFDVATFGAASPALVGARGLQAVGRGMSYGSQQAIKAGMKKGVGGRVGDAIDDLSEGAFTGAARKYGGQITEDVMQTAQSEFLKGELREDTDGSIMESFSPTALAMESGADLGIMGLMHLAGMPRRGAKSRNQKDTKAYKYGAERGAKAREQFGDMGQSTENDATMGALALSIEAKAGPDARKGFVDAYRSGEAGKNAKPVTKEAIKKAKVDKEAKVAATKRDTVAFKDQDPLKPLETIIKEGRKKTDPNEPITLSNLEYQEKQLAKVDKSKLNKAQLETHARRTKEIEDLKGAATELEHKLVKERVAKLKGKKLRAAYRQAKENSGKATETARNKIYNDAVIEKYKTDKPEGTVNFSKEALDKTDERHGQTLAEDEFYDTDNPKAEAKKAIDDARKTDEYQEAIDDIIAAQNREWIQNNDGIKDKDKKKDLSLTRKREIVEEYIANNDLTIAERVAASDMYNENTDRMFKGNRKADASKEAKQKRRQAHLDKQNKENKDTTKTEPETKSDTFEYKKEDTETKQPSKTYGDYELVKNEAGGFDVMLNGEKVTGSNRGGLDVAKQMADKHAKKTAEADTTVKGEQATGEYLEKQAKGADLDDVTVSADPSKFKGRMEKAKAFAKDSTIFLRDWINDKKTLDHELLHVLLDAAYDMNSDVKKFTDDVMNEVRDSIDKTDLSNADKKMLKAIGDNQELLVTILGEPDLLAAFGQIESNYSVEKTALQSMVKILKDIIDSLSGAKDNSVAHQMVDLMVVQSEHTADIRAFDRESIQTAGRASINDSKNPFHKAEPMASKFLKGKASGAWRGINKLYNRADKNSKLVKYLEDVGSGTLVHKILTQWEVEGIHVLESVNDLANEMSAIDSNSRTNRGYTVQEIRKLLPQKKSVFGTTILVDEQKLADEVMGLDLQSLPVAVADRIIESDFDPKVIEKELMSISKQLNIVLGKADIKRKKDFNKAARFLVEQILGNQKDASVIGYGSNNANQLLYNFTDIKGVNKEAEGLLDSFITLKAMERRKPSELKKLEKANLKEIIAMHRHSVNLFKENVGSGPQYRKGYLGGSMDTYWEYEYMDNETFNALHNKEGWTFMAGAEEGYVHAKRRAAYLKYEKGAIPTNQYKAKGGKRYNNTSDMLEHLEQQAKGENETKRAFNRRIMAAGRKVLKNEFEPYYNDAGTVQGFRRVMSDSMKREHLGFKTKISDAIANNIMDAHREVVYRDIVNKVNDSMSTKITANTDVKDIIANVDKKDAGLFLKGDSGMIRSKLHDAFLKKYYNEVTPDIRAILPANLKDTAFISKKYQDELIGYRNEFLSDNRHLQLAEMWWRDMVIHFKESVIKKNPLAVMTNMMGNMIMLMLEGANPVFMAKEIHRAKRDIDTMYKGIKEINRLELQLGKHNKGTKAHTALTAKIKAEQKKLNDSDAHIGMSDGWYQSAIDDIYSAEHSSASPISKVSESVYRKMIEKTGIKSKESADNIVKAGCDILMTKDSRSGRAAEKFISYSDYTSRLVMYRLKRSQGMSKEAASKLARDAFVDYRRQLPKELNALKVSGVVPFITWAFRMQPVLAKRAIENPIKTAALLGAYGAATEGMGVVAGARVGNWIPQTAFMDASIVGGIPKNLANGEFPSEAMVPKFWEYIAKGDIDKLVGVDLR